MAMVFATLCCVAFASARAGDKEELLRLTADAHRSAIQSIRTFSCHIEIDENEKPKVSNADYWRSCDTVRIVEEFHQQPGETLVREGRNDRGHLNEVTALTGHQTLRFLHSHQRTERLS